MIEAKVICDSVNNKGNRLTTLQLKYPRFIHAEFMTHRVFSRNASSSRAIPFKRCREAIEKGGIAEPVFWGKNQKGMQAFEELSEKDKDLAKEMWKEGYLAVLNTTIKYTRQMDDMPHKQIINRMLEPWAHINVVVSATEWQNFFDLRLHPDAQPEIQALAKAIKKAMDNSVPAYSEFHCPYYEEEDMWVLAEFVDNYEQDTKDTLDINEILLLPIITSVARCARVSYKTFDSDKRSDIISDIKLFRKLYTSEPMHASPMEHVAFWAEHGDNTANFNGWVQFRHIDMDKKTVVSLLDKLEVYNELRSGV